MGLCGLLLQLVASAAPAALAPPPIVCTPESVHLPGRAVQRSAHPIAAALSAARPGQVIQLRGGDYGPFTIGFANSSVSNAATSGGRRGAPVVIDGLGAARIVGRDGGDALAIHQQVPNGHITFRNLTIRPGGRAGVLFFKQTNGAIHEGYSFENCDIISEFDHVSGRGDKSKWGVWGHSLKDFRFVGRGRPARIENIRYEHAFYLQNPRGDITIENVHARRLGRTFCQFTARRGDGPPGEGDITVRDCVVEDVGLSEWDGYKGGSAFTVAGRLRGTLLFERNRYRAGFDPTVKALTKGGRPYGTGAFVAWNANREERNGTLVLRDNDFRFASGCGDRPVVSIGGCDRVLVLGRNRFVSGGQEAALSLDPVDDAGNAVGTANGTAFVAPQTVLEGRVEVEGQRRRAADLARLKRAHR